MKAAGRQGRMFRAGIVFAFLAAWGCGEARAEGKDRYTIFPYVQDVTPSSAVIRWETAGEAAGLLTVGKKRMPLPPSPFQEVRVTGLKPDTWYTYAVGGEEAGRFRTFPADREAPVRFVIYGDTRSRPEVHRRIGKLAAAQEPLFIVHSGDFVSHGPERAEWIEEYFVPLRDLIARVPVFTAVGNHERDSRWYHRFFVQPGNERWYSFDAGCVHVVVLDSNVRDVEDVRLQKEWLAADLRKKRAAWTFVVLHHSPLSRRAAGLSMTALNEYVPLFFAHGVDFVFAGHDHYYKRSLPFVQGAGVVRFFVSAGGGAPLRKLKRRESWDARAVSRHHLCLVEASPREVRIRVKAEDGTEIDALTVRKEDDLPRSAVPFGETARRVGEMLQEIFLEDEDEMKESIAVSFPGLEGDPRPGVEIGGTIRLLGNPFRAPMRVVISWDTRNSSWKVSPAGLVLKAMPGKAASASFTAVPGRPPRPGPALNVEVSFGGEKTGKAVQVIFPLPAPPGE